MSFLLQRALFQMDMSEQFISTIFIFTFWSNDLFVFTFPTNTSGVMQCFMTQTHQSARQTHIHDASDTVLESEDSLDARSCPTEVRNGAYLPVNERSTCPWYYEVNRDTNRYPEVILNAVTPCTSSCIGRDDTYQCYPITRNIQVFKFKQDYNSTHRIYEPSDIDITVGFTCASRRMILNRIPLSITPTYA